MNLKKINTPRGWRDLEGHQFAQAINFGAGIDIDDLAGHILRNGYDESEPVVIYQGKILDGRHRLEAAKKNSITPIFKEFVGTDEEAVQFVMKKAHRQHLDAGQKTALIDALLELERNFGPMPKSPI